MTGRQILDAIFIIKASRSVIAKHIDLRRRQLDVYSKTSSLAKAVKSQTSRFPFIARTVSNLADQVKSSRGYGSASPTAPQVASKHDPQMTGSENTEGTDTSPGANPTTEQIPGEELGTRLDNAKRSSTPVESVLLRKDEKPSPNRGRDTFSDRSLTESRTNPLGDTDGKSDEILQPSSTTRTSIPTPSTHESSTEHDRARKLQRLAEEQVPSISAEAHPPSEIQTPASNHRLGEPDTNKQQDVFFTRPVHSSPVLSSLPRVKLPKTTTSTQDGIENLSNVDINQDVFYSAKPAGSPVPDAQALPEQGQPSDAMYSEIFHSPRVARLLKMEDQKGRSQDLLHKTDKKSVSSVPPVGSETADPLEEKDAKNTRQLAEDIVNDSTSASSTTSEVSFPLHLKRNHILMN